MTPPSDEMLEHYQREDVKDVIMKVCEYNNGFRCLNGDDGWYIHNKESARLRGPSDYNDTISKARSLYITADVFLPGVFDQWETWMEGRGGEGKPTNPLGTRADLLGYSLFADIDATKDPNDTGNRSKIYHEGRKEALEAAAAFMVNYLKEHGIHDAVRVAFSGQGIYVLLHPGLSARPEPGEDGPDLEKYDRDYKIWLIAFNALLSDIEAAFFQVHPEHSGKVKFDKLNNVKRKIKCILSIHRTLPFAVVPLDKSNPKIDFEAAKVLTLSSEMVEKARVWVESWTSSDSERHSLALLLKPYASQASEEITERVRTSGKIPIRDAPLPIELWCPFYKKLLNYGDTTGKHRAMGALASWLYQAGWNETEAFDLWYPVAARCDVETRIFYTSYGVISSPSCETIKKASAGYPSLGFGGLNLCNPDEGCEGARWPGDYQILETITEEELNAARIEGPKFINKLPPDHLITRFMGYGDDVSDAYPEFWYGGALHLLSVLSDKKLFLILRQMTVYPNLYIILTGKSSSSRKTTAVDKTEAILNRVKLDTITSKVPTEFSPEAFIEHMDANNHAPWIRDEAAGVLEAMRKTYMAGFKDAMMQIYDCKPYYRKLRTSAKKNTKTEFNVDDPYLNLLWATTDTALAKNTDTNDTLSGFMARFLYHFPQRKRDKWLPLEEGTALNSALETVVLNHLHLINKMVMELGDGMGQQELDGEEPGRMHLSKEAAEFWIDWQRKREAEADDTNDSDVMQIYSRLAPTVAKLAILFEVGAPDFDPKKPIRLEFVVEACRQVDEYYLPTAKAVYDTVGADSEKNVIDKIIRFLKKHNDHATRRQISRHTKIKARELEEYLETMLGDGTVEEKEVKGETGRPSVCIILRV